LSPKTINSQHVNYTSAAVLLLQSQFGQEVVFFLCAQEQGEEQEQIRLERIVPISVIEEW